MDSLIVGFALKVPVTQRIQGLATERIFSISYTFASGCVTLDVKDSYQKVEESRILEESILYMESNDLDISIEKPYKTESVFETMNYSSQRPVYFSIKIEQNSPFTYSHFKKG